MSRQLHAPYRLRELSPRFIAESGSGSRTGRAWKGRFAAGVVLVFLVGAALANPLQASELIRELNRAFVDAVDTVAPSVVIVTVLQTSGSTHAENSADAGPPSAPFGFSVGQGSGVIIRKDGFILTNRHVVEDAEKIEVRLKDGRRFQATLRGSDRESDVAVLKIEAHGLRAARLANSDRVRVGEFVAAIGIPYELDFSATFGHVSAKGRANILPTFFGSGMMDQDFIQTDANINPGNSGGPLINLEGQVIGINTLIRGRHTGIGFAIPSNLAREISDQIVTHGRFVRPWLGVALHDLQEDPAYEDLRKEVTGGVVVARIMPGGPSEGSELRARDVITRLGGHRVSTAQELRNQLRSRPVGQKLALQVFRDGRKLTIHVAPGEYHEPAPEFGATPPANHLAPVDLGLLVHVLTDDLAARYQATVTNGVLVIAVDPDGPAEHHGIQPGDVISSVDGKDTFNPPAFRSALDAGNWGAGVRIQINHRGTSRTETITLPEK